MKLFDSGENLKINNTYNGKIIINNIEAKFPGRVQMCPLDFTSFEFGIPAGGGYGVPIEMNNYIKIKTAEKDTITGNEDKKILVNHYVILMKKILNIDVGLEIDIKLDNIAKQHFGVGSSASIAAAVCYSINYMCGNIISVNKLVEIISNNYVEIYKNKLTFGMTTGVSLHSILRGEFVIVANDADLIYSKKVPNGYKIILINTNLKRDDMDKPENIEQINRSRELDIEYQKIRSELFLMKIIPELNKDNWKTLFKYNTSFQLNGGQLGVIESYENQGKIIKDIINYFSNFEDMMIGVTSVGPTVFAYIKDETDVIKYCNSNNLEYRIFNISKGIEIL
ncbi:MAG: hypothetical protein J6A89_04480 [Clostridia bacterium]|nr:hypothetical protein [Clostridia bacterium]